MLYASATQRRTDDAMNSYLPSRTFALHERDRSESFSSLEDDLANDPSIQEALVELRERQVLEQYYAASRVLKEHIRGGAFIVKAASISPVSKTVKVKTL